MTSKRDRLKKKKKKAPRSTLQLGHQNKII